MAELCDANESDLALLKLLGSKIEVMILCFMRCFLILWPNCVSDARDTAYENLGGTCCAETKRQGVKS